MARSPMISVNANLSALRLRNCLNNNSSLVQKALERMSTGYRINSAADDAAGLSVATNLNVQTRGLNVANKNLQNASTILNIAESSLDSMNTMLQRMRNLALQSANGVYSYEERNAMQEEVDSLFEEIVRTKNSTEYNGQNLFGKQTTIDKSQTYTDLDTIQTLSTASIDPIITQSSTMPFSASPSIANLSATPSTPSTSSTSTAGEILSPKLMSRSVPTPLSNSTTPALMSLALDNEPIETGTITLKYNDAQRVNFGLFSYTMTGVNPSGDTTVSYAYDPNTGHVEFSGNLYSVQGASNQNNNLTLKGDNVHYWAPVNSINNVEFIGKGSAYYSGANSADNIIFNGDNASYTGKAGSSANITINGTNARIMAVNNMKSNCIINGGGNHIFGGSEASTYELNSNNSFVKGGNGDDTFKVNSGFSGNIIEGGGGEDTLIDNGTNTGKINISGVADWLPESGTIAFMEDEAKTINFFGNTYDITNIFSESQVSYTYDSASQTLELNANSCNIKAHGGQEDKLIIAGSSNTIDTGDENDEVTILSGYSRNTVKTGAGDDIITANCQSNAIYGGSGSDIINVNNTQIIFKMERGIIPSI